MTHYIRIEAVNIYNAIDDTNNISIIRGGSLLLKQAIEDLQEKFKEDIQPISTGASIGVFVVKTEGVDKKRIINFLNTEKKYRYFTFAVVDCIETDYQKAKEILIAKVRYLQLQQLSASADYANIPKDAKPCEVEGVRPATEVVWIQDANKTVNEFAKLKFEYGKQQRNKLYKDELNALLETGKEADAEQIKKLLLLKFTDDLEALSNAPEQANLSGKIAVVYFDGNGFSKIQNALVKTDEQQIQFDKQIKKYRREFLVALLERCTKDSSWFFKQQLRLETLLWGGDEMLFVVPAWKGFELLDLFYEVSEKWQITIGAEPPERLTHAGGIVFCPCKTPIDKIRELAQQLADDVKNQPNGREKNYFNYLTLESIDYPAESLDVFFEYKYSKLAKHRSYLNPIVLFDSKRSICLSELELIPKSQAYAMAQLACQLDAEAFDKQRERLLAVSENQDKLKEVIEKMTRIFYPQLVTEISTEYEAMMWIHLVELWDYLLPFVALKPNNQENLA